MGTPFAGWLVDINFDFPKPVGSTEFQQRQGIPSWNGTTLHERGCTTILEEGGSSMFRFLPAAAVAFSTTLAHADEPTRQVSVEVTGHILAPKKLDPSDADVGG